MKKTLFFVFALALVFAGCKQKADNSYTISGTLPSGVDAKMIYLYAADGDKPVVVDSARIEKGSFHFKGIAPDTLQLMVLHPGSLEEYPALAWSLFLEPGDMVVDTLSEFVTGTPVNDGLHDWMGQLTNIMMTSGDPSAFRLFFEQHWQEHSSDFVGAVTLAQMSPYLDFAFVDSLANQVPAELRTHYLVASFYEQLEAMRSMQPGKPFTDVALVALDGTPTSLSDYIGKGKYVLVDFWASWCGPCRQAMPDLQNTVKKFPKLTVLGIAVSDKVDDTEKAVKDLKISWPVLSDTDAISARKYGVNAIPAKILFDPDGTILARDLNVMTLEETLSKISF